ncbi:hypothetical protein AVEN_240980-1 [Araneus ventricosus]|uniref:Transposable element Tc3 transposase n=1 Tax=Araneus ventricosus TaxID=182803 RepID=A0A4Y2RIH8_ARAVE|nr:hypothetical protein AVEN_240980-1 [Araneus ventricosus]
MQNKKQWNIFWTDEAHFRIHGYVNTQICRIWATKNPFVYQLVPLHSEKVTVSCGFTASFIEGIFFFKEIGPTGPVPSMVDAMNLFCATMAFQQRACVGHTLFMQDGAPTHIANPV